MITTFYPPYSFGGDGVFVHALANELARRGHAVDVVHCIDAYTLAASRPPQAYCDHPAVTVHGLESAWGPLSPLMTHQTGWPMLKSARLRSILAKGFDVIHYHNITLVGGPGVLTLGRGIKLYTMHDYWLVCPTHALFRFNREPCAEADRCASCTLVHGRPPQWWRYSSLLRTALTHVDAFIAPTLMHQRKHEQMGHQGRIAHIPNFVSLPDTGAPPNDRPARAPEGKPYFLFVGRLEKLKGLHTLIPAWRDYARAELWIAGTGSEEANLRASARNNPNVRFLGFQNGPRLDALYRGAVALLYPTVNFQSGVALAGVHGAPLVIMEAFSRETPVIAGNAGRIHTLVEQTGGGLVYSTPHELWAAMDSLLADPQRRQALGRSGYDAFRQQWTPEAHLRQYFELIHEIEARRSTARPRQSAD